MNVVVVIKMACEWFKGPIFFGFPIPDYTAIRRQHISLLYHPKLPLLNGVKKDFCPLCEIFCGRNARLALEKKLPKVYK